MLARHISAIRARPSQLLLAMAWLTYVVVVATHSVNWPFADDFDTTIRFALEFSQGEWSSRIGAFFAPNNEHRIVFNHLTETIELLLFGFIDLRHLVGVGTLAWIGCAVVIWRIARDSGLSPSECIPSTLVLSAFSHYDLMTWAMGSLQQYGQLLFALLTIWSATRGHFGWTCLGLIASLWTGGGGYALIPCLLVHQLLEREWLRAGTITLLALIMIGIHIYSMPPVAAAAHDGMVHLLDAPWDGVLYVLCFIGSAAKSTPASVATGMLLVGVVVSRWRDLYARPTIMLMLMFVLLCATLAAASRVHLGISQARTSRYTEYSLVAISLIFVLVIANANTPETRRKIRHACLGIAVAIWTVWALHGYKSIADRAAKLKAHQIMTPGDTTHIPSMMEQALRIGVFRP